MPASSDARASLIGGSHETQHTVTATEQSILIGRCEMVSIMDEAMEFEHEELEVADPAKC